MLHPKTDIRSMFNKNSGQNTHDAHVIFASEAAVSAISAVSIPPPPLEKNKKVIKRDEIDVLCDAYYKAYTGDKCKGIVNHDVESVKETLKEIVEKCKVKSKKMYRYFHHVKVSSKNSDTIFKIECLLLHPFKFITFEHQFISYKEAMSICTEKGLTPPLEMRRNAWVYDYFIGKQNKLYISEIESQQLLIDFNKEFIFYNGNAAQSLLMRGYIVERTFGSKYYYTTQEFIDFEIKTSDKLMELFYNEPKEAEEVDEAQDKAIDAHIKLYTMEQHNIKDFKFEPEQVEAIKKGCRLNKMQLLNITGPPGTGKSTIVDCIMNFKLRHGGGGEEEECIIAIMAPTGLAQKNLKNSCKCDSKFSGNVMFSTLHRALNFTFKDKKNKFKPTTIIVDESSMVDLFLFNKLLCACERFKCSLILIGDVKQLPPISAGTPFESIINSKIFDTTVLTNIKRQNGNLKTIIEKLNHQNGVHYDDFDGICSSFIEAKTPDDFERVVTEIYKKEMMQKVGIHTMCVQREKTGGVFALNPIIQKLKNPNGEELFVKRYEGAHTHIFHEGDLVIRTENDYKDENNVRVNGDVGTIHQTKTKVKRYGKDVYDYKYTIKYETGKEEDGLTSGDVQDAFMPFYASSVHKMQGLQETVIVFIVSPAHNFCLTNENSKKLIYTAISRCKANFYVVGDKSLFIKAQRSKVEFTYPTLFMTEFNEYE
jgi:hypothetical protein